MIIHFICRGNVFRSIIAEAYLNSLELKDLSALSSGTVATSHKEQNLANHRLTLGLLDEHGIRGFAKDDYGDQLTQARLDKGDVSVCLNQRVYDDCLRLVTFSGSPRVWSVADIGEPGRVPSTEAEARRYREEAYQEIVGNVERLVSEMRRGGASVGGRA
jgi:protein-tyrosine-phosphatase